jgi:hypothetical protein
LGGDRVSKGLGWRIIVVTGGDHPALVWDSGSHQKDGSFAVMSGDDFNVSVSGPADYDITFQGCAAHNCGDGQLGYAVYARRLRRVFVAHVTTDWAGNHPVTYTVAYDPPTGIPAAYQAELQRMICTDNGVTMKAKLPFDCHAK